MKELISKILLALEKSPFGQMIGWIGFVSGFIFAMWSIALMVYIIGWPFIYFIEKITG